MVVIEEVENMIASGNSFVHSVLATLQSHFPAA